MAKLYTYMIGIEPSDWDFNDTKECKKYGLTCKGYYKLGDNEGMVLVGELDNIEDIMEMYFGLEIVDECLCPIDEFDYEDGRWVTGGWTESKKSMKKSLKESVDGYIATDEDCNMSGKGWVLDGSYNFIMEFLQEWGIAPKDVKVKNGMTTLYNADGNPFGYVYQDEEVDIFVADKTINWTWENHNPSTKRVKVIALDEIF